MRTIRIGARWHLIERVPGRYEFDSLRTILDAAYEMEMEVVLDVLHFGWPDHVDIFAPEFPAQFARFTFALTRYLARHRANCRMFAPVNEISFLSWGGGDTGCINPHATNRGHELKRNLVRAAALSSEILLNEIPDARLVSPEPLIHIVGHPAIPGDELEAALYTQAQFQAWDMLSGRMSPELGGKPEYLDILGVNFYDRNEWVHNLGMLLRDDPRYRPFRDMLQEVWNRYRRPLFVSETGTEDCARADWFNYVCDEVFAARRAGVPVYGICLYPILNHPGWEDDRHCHNGLFDYANDNGDRDIHWALADALTTQQQRFAASKESIHDPQQHRPDLSVSSPLGIRIPAPSASNEPLRT
ncbi:MAG TPA: hypothetical protein VHU83_11370 [Bryobacteraceae bacterium]|nr:hypothetical protein [Bryobacteraceae bacterium]